MVRLFEDACRQLLAVAPDDRPAWLAAWTSTCPQAELLAPVAAHFAGQEMDAAAIDDALAWCRTHIMHLSA